MVVLSIDVNGGKFIFLIGVFVLEDCVCNWLGKFKGEKVLGYIEYKKVFEKGDLVLL